MGVEPEVVGEAGEQPEAPAEPAAVPARKRGETPRQQIRKAKKATRRRFSAEEKIRIVMEGIRGEEPVSAICRREGIQSTVYYRWLKDFMEAGKQRLRGDTLREAGRDEVQALKAENQRLKELVADYALETLALKKSLTEG
jgi:transposase